MSFAALITILTRGGAQSGAMAFPCLSVALPQLPELLPSPEPDTEVPPPPARAGAVGSAINASEAARNAPASLIRVPGFPLLERSCLGVSKIASLLRRPAGLAVGLALKEPAPPP